jgi:hypothetical protein
MSRIEIANFELVLDQQEVKATVAVPGMNVLDMVPIGSKEPLPSDLINITDFEWSMSQGYEKNNNRGSFPTSSWPNPKDRIQSNFPELVWNYYLPNLASFALGAYQRPVQDYLDADSLKNSYQAAYRLLLARKLADILSTEVDRNNTALATRRYQTQTVIMVPTFVYIVGGLLVTTTIIALLVFVIPSWKRTNLVSEPGSIASLMTLVGKDLHIVDVMSGEDRATSQELEGQFQDTTFVLQKRSDFEEPTLCYLNPKMQSRLKEDPTVDPTAPILPPELSWPAGLGFLILQGLVMGALVYAYVRVQLHDGNQP